MLYHIITLGCQMNKSDSERVRTVLDKMGFRWTNDEKEADLLGILACSVRQKAIDKAYSRISLWNKWKNKKNLLTFVSGCFLPNDKVRFLKLFDLVFTMDELPEVQDMIRQYGIVTPYSLAVDGISEEPVSQETNQKAAEFPTLLEMLQTKDSIKIDVNTINSVSTDNSDNRSIMDGFWHIKPHYSSRFEAFIPIQNGCDKFLHLLCCTLYKRTRSFQAKF